MDEQPPGANIVRYRSLCRQYACVNVGTVAGAFRWGILVFEDGGIARATFSRKWSSYEEVAAAGDDVGNPMLRQPSEPRVRA
ncbi:hypothetical protein MRX96_035757 [Rhipicephalus microplus]